MFKYDKCEDCRIILDGKLHTFYSRREREEGAHETYCRDNPFSFGKSINQGISTGRKRLKV